MKVGLFFGENPISGMTFELKVLIFKNLSKMLKNTLKNYSFKKAPIYLDLKKGKKKSRKARKKPKPIISPKSL